MKKEKGEVRTRTSDRLRAAGITEPEDTMVEGSGSKRDSLITSKKRGRNEPPKEDAIVSKSQVYRRKYEKKKQEEIKEKKRNYKRSLIATLSNLHGIMLFCIYFGGGGLRVVEESMDHGIDQVLIYASV
uniref:Uncharacterized protein n=1 Tax=Cucumis melo TaxID=3656 RepID=A0A9I9E7X6_CUCME